MRNLNSIALRLKYSAKIEYEQDLTKILTKRTIQHRKEKHTMKKCVARRNCARNQENSMENEEIQRILHREKLRPKPKVQHHAKEKRAAKPEANQDRAMRIES